MQLKGGGEELHSMRSGKAQHKRRELCNTCGVFAHVQGERRERERESEESCVVVLKLELILQEEHFFFRAQVFIIFQRCYSGML